jgi:hypothetical protein
MECQITKISLHPSFKLIAMNNSCTPQIEREAQKKVHELHLYMLVAAFCSHVQHITCIVKLYGVSSITDH